MCKSEVNQADIPQLERHLEPRAGLLLRKVRNRRRTSFENYAACTKQWSAESSTPRTGGTFWVRYAEDYVQAESTFTPKH